MHGPFVVSGNWREARGALRAQGRFHAQTCKVYSQGGWLTNAKYIRVGTNAELASPPGVMDVYWRRTVGGLNPQMRSEGCLHCWGHFPIKRQANGPEV